MFAHPTGKSPKRVVILAMGPTRKDYLDLLSVTNAKQIQFDEVWGVNNIFNVTPVDMTFAMDDFRMLQYAVPDMAEQIKNAPHPVMTAVAYKECPTAVSFPLAEVLTSIRGASEFLNHTVAYMLAYAAYIGVEEVIIFGADYITLSERYGTRSDEGWQLVARYMQCSAYWAGICAARGMEVVVTPNSPFLGVDRPAKDNFYGYLIPPRITREGE